MPKSLTGKVSGKKLLAGFARAEQVPLMSSNANHRFTPEEAAAMAEPHSPECFLVCCIDSRFQPAKALGYGPGVTLEYRQIAAAVPPQEGASADFLGRMAFRRLNDIDHILLASHSDCGGAQAALKVPNPDLSSGDDLHEVAAIAHRSGLDIAAVGQKFMAEEKGDLRRAGDRLAREIGIRARENLMGYKGRDGYATIGDEVAAGALKVLLVHYDLEQRSFELYDEKKRAWKPKPASALLARTAATLQGCAAPQRHAAGAKK